MAKKISGSVGKGGRNNLDDVRVIQELLNANIAELIPYRPLMVNGINDRNTESMIEEFQRRVVCMRTPDGRVDPCGKTWELLLNNSFAACPPVAHVFSAQGAALLKGIEKLKLKPYDDQTGKEVASWVEGATIGYGHLIAEGDWDQYKDGITEAQATTLFTNDLAPFVRAVNLNVTASLSQNQFDALVILAFNIGVGHNGFAGSSVLKMVNDPSAVTSYANLESAWKAWNKSQGKVMEGLNNRRNAEWNIYSQNIYKSW